MKITIKKPVEVEIAWVRVTFQRRYEEDLPDGTPMLVGDTWSALINIDTGEIQGWPQGIEARIATKVCDMGTYQLLDKGCGLIAEINGDYCPNKLIPGEYGDYIDLDVDESGKIRNWPKHPDVSRFFREDEE